MIGPPTLTQVASRFSVSGAIRAITPLGEGLINDTWLVTTDRSLGVLQKINGSIFPRPEWNLRNLRRVVDHLEAKGEQRLALPRPIPSRCGRDWVEEQGQFWRMLEYIDGIVLRRVNSRETARSLGWSLGHLHSSLADLDPAGFHDTLPGFHLTSRYLDEFDRVLAGWRGSANDDVKSALKCVERFRSKGDVLEQAGLPRRIIHGDPKLDNVLFDVSGERPLAWVDLDTLMPGSVLYDIGDCVRAACGDKGWLNLGLAQALLTGWYEQTRRFLTSVEIALVPHAVWLLPFELGVRFLTDYLAGNRYFRVSDPEENLSRAQGQLALARNIDLRFDRLSQVWEGISEAPGR